MKKGIIVFVKNPVLGTVKTRLAATLGDEKALAIYLKLLAYTHQVVSMVKGCEKYIYYTPTIDYDDHWDNQATCKALQAHGDLGIRMSSAFKDVFQSCDKAIIIGSDCPRLKPHHIESAFEKLNNHDMVIGPSLDGGYYLLGLNNHYPKLFEKIAWSTDSVFQSTISTAKSIHLRTFTLERLPDIDYEADWVKYGF